MSRLDPEGWRAPALLGVVATTAVILPAFLTGAVAVQLRDDLSLAESTIGLAIGAFFLGSTIGSTGLGRLAEQLGPRPALTLALVLTAAADLALAGLARGPRSLALLLVVAGLANALGQPAVNLLVVRTVAGQRLGLVMALKQSGMPAAALLGGLAVPTLALTVGWRAAFLVGAALALAAIPLQATVPAVPTATGPAGPVPPVGPGGPGKETATPEPVDTGGGTARPDQGWGVLGLMAGVGILGGGAANIVVGYLVSGAVDAGIGPGRAGLLLTGGSALGIVSRLVHGSLADRGRIDALVRVVTLLGLGAVGAMLLALDRPGAYLIATPIVFAAGWAWPGLFNLVVVQTNRSAPAAATGVTQTGVYLGSIVGPILAGWLIETSGYRAAWLLTALALATAAGATVSVRSALAEVRQPPIPG